MAAPKRPTHVVVKDGLYLTTNSKTGRLQKMPVDTQLTLNDNQAEKLEKRGFVKSLKEAKNIDMSEPEAKS